MADSHTEDGFRIVTSKRKSRRNFQRPLHHAVVENSTHDEFLKIDIPTTLRHIKRAEEDLSASIYYESFKLALVDSLNKIGSPNITSIVCFGLGHICECLISRYQLALLLLLQKQFGIDNPEVHDPIFNKADLAVLTKLGCNVITANEEGKHAIGSDTFTVFYLPHCPKQLMNNLLWCNWGPRLKNCILIGNSFLKIIESSTKRHLIDNAFYILNINQYIEEIIIVNNFKYCEIFNETSIHVFPKKLIDEAPSTIWLNNSEPVYNDQDIELISNKLISALKI